MQAVLIKNDKGPSTSLYLSETNQIPIPQRINSDDVLIRVKCFGLNRMDILQREGKYPLPPGASTILGVEFSGIVEEESDEDLKYYQSTLETKTTRTTTTDNSSSGRFKKGDKVFGLVTGGAYAQYVICSSSMLFKFPEIESDNQSSSSSSLLKLDFVTAASIPEVWLTATQVTLLIGQLSSQESFLFHSGASGVGLAALQIAQGTGASKIFTTVGSDEKKKFLKDNIIISNNSLTKNNNNDNNNFIPINYKTENFLEITKKYTQNKGLDLIIDPVGQSYFQNDLYALGRGGRLVSMGLMSGGIIKSSSSSSSSTSTSSTSSSTENTLLDISPILSKNLKIEGTTLRGRDRKYKQLLKSKFENQVLPKILDKTYHLFIEAEFQWNDIILAHQLMESNTTTGKIIVHVS